MPGEWLLGSIHPLIFAIIPQNMVPSKLCIVLQDAALIDLVVACKSKTESIQHTFQRIWNLLSALQQHCLVLDHHL